MIRARFYAHPWATANPTERILGGMTPHSKRKDQLRESHLMEGHFDHWRQATTPSFVTYKVMGGASNSNVDPKFKYDRLGPKNRR